MKLYIFRTVPLSIIRSFSLYTQQWHISYRFADSLRAGSEWNCSSKVKPEAATAVIELLMMGGKTPETCWAVNKSQDNKLEKLLHLVGDLFELSQVVLSLSTLTEHLSITDPDRDDVTNNLRVPSFYGIYRRQVTNSTGCGQYAWNTSGVWHWEILLIKASLCVTTVYRITQSHRETTGRIRYPNDSDTILTTRLHTHTQEHSLVSEILIHLSMIGFGMWIGS